MNINEVDILENYKRNIISQEDDRLFFISLRDYYNYIKNNLSEILDSIRNEENIYSKCFYDQEKIVLQNLEALKEDLYEKINNINDIKLFSIIKKYEDENNNLSKSLYTKFHQRNGQPLIMPRNLSKVYVLVDVLVFNIIPYMIDKGYKVYESFILKSHNDWKINLDGLDKLQELEDLWIYKETYEEWGCLKKLEDLFNSNIFELLNETKKLKKADYEIYFIRLHIYLINKLHRKNLNYNNISLINKNFYINNIKIEIEKESEYFACFYTLFVYSDVSGELMYDDFIKNLKANPIIKNAILKNPNKNIDKNYIVRLLDNSQGFFRYAKYENSGNLESKNIIKKIRGKGIRLLNKDIISFK